MDGRENDPLNVATPAEFSAAPPTWNEMPSASIGIAAIAGCSHHDKPHNYGKARPPVDELDSRDRGLQSKDVVSASDQMAQANQPP